MEFDDNIDNNTFWLHTTTADEPPAADRKKGEATMMNSIFAREWLEGNNFMEIEKDLYQRTLTKEVDVAFHGKMNSDLTVTVCIDEKAKQYRVSYHKNNTLIKEKTYALGWNRSRNAILDTIEYQGYADIL